jgi:hypothetical protein
MHQRGRARRRLGAAGAVVALAPASVVAGGVVGGGFSSQPVDALALAQPADPGWGVLPPAPDADTAGMFGPLASWPIVAIHASVLPSGEVVTYGTPPGQAQSVGQVLVTWDPAAGWGPGSTRSTAPQSVDGFCNLAKVQADGRLSWSAGTARVRRLPSTVRPSSSRPCRRRRRLRAGTARRFACPTIACSSSAAVR